jgi:cytochrome c biogenesis protein CcdA
MQILTYIYSIGAAQGFILAIALWRKTENKQSISDLAINHGF